MAEQLTEHEVLTGWDDTWLPERALGGGAVASSQVAELIQAVELDTDHHDTQLRWD